MKNTGLIWILLLHFQLTVQTLQAQQGVYCIPAYTYGTQGPNGKYTQNDFINHVILNGEIGYPVLNSNLNCCGPNIPPWNGGPAAFSAHPPDYASFPLTPGNYTVLQKCPGNYLLQVQLGDRPSQNYVAAWIDFNKDSVFDASEKIMQTPGLGLPNLG